MKPRLWLHSLPKDIISRAEPKNERENRLTKTVLLPLVIIILPGLSILSAWNAATTTGTDLTFLGTVVHLYGIWIIVHVWDFVIIDCGAILVIDPTHPPIRGTEGAAGWSDYKFHFRAMLRAVVMSAVFVVPASLFVSLVI
ncbi:MAG TPA: hypothetical protein VK508_02085 [Cyclobacteriaceae bacterium]|nr:hypothetical protein [Cyclobacteriaceae bacterium]